MKKKPLHKAYAAIEDTMMVAVRAMVTPRAEKLISEVREALSRDDFAEARRLVDTFTIRPAIDAQLPKLKELAVSAMLFGASRHKPVHEVSHVLTNQIPFFVDQAVTQLCTGIEYGGTLRIKAAALLIISDAEEKRDAQRKQSALLKHNPYHDEEGKFTTADNAVTATYVASYSGKKGTYDTRFFKVTDEELKDDDGTVVGTKQKLISIREIVDQVPAKEEEGIIFRGMSEAEYTTAMKDGQIKSAGLYNIGDDQKGLTYYSTNPDEAASYSANFAPKAHKPTFGKPAYVVAVKRPGDDSIKKVKGTAESEIGVKTAIPTSDIVGVYRGNVIDEGIVGVWLNWEKVDLKKFDPDQPRAPAGTANGGQWVKQTELQSFKEWSGGAPVIEHFATSDYKGGPAVFEAFHGTTHPDIEEVDTNSDKSTGEGFLGAGFYTTTSVDDASENYARVGPDLESRIERAMEEMTDPFYSDDYVRDETMRDWLASDEKFQDNQGVEYSAQEWVADREDLPKDFDYDDLTDDQKNSIAQSFGEKAIRFAAHESMKGKSDGLMMPVYVKVEKPFDFRPSGLQLTIDQETNDDGDFVGEPTGSGIQFIEALRSVGSEWNLDTSDVESYIFENPDGASAYDIWNKVYSVGHEFYDPDGKSAGPGAFMQAVAREAGYDGFVMDADQAFKHMAGMESGEVLHVMPFNPNQVKSSIGNSGAFSRTDNNITKGELQTTAVKKIDMTAEEIGAALSAAVMNGTRMLADVASNVTTSRLASYGFLVEAQRDGVQAYMISAILDDRTCPVCAELDGTVFEMGVSPALSRLEQSLHTDDPNDLRVLAPWPAQDKESVKELERATTDDLQALGYDAPPFHPYCRCILVAVNDQELGELPPTPEPSNDNIVELPEERETIPTRVPVNDN